MDLDPRVGSKTRQVSAVSGDSADTVRERGLPSTVILPLSTRLIADAFPLRRALRKARALDRSTATSRRSDPGVGQRLSLAADLGELPEALQDEVRAAMREFLDL